MGCLIKTPLPDTNSPNVTCILIGRVAIVAYGIGASCSSPKVRIMTGY